MPANVVALVMKAEPGAELACRARNYRFEPQGLPQERGVISYYAVQTLAQATTLAGGSDVVASRTLSCYGAC